MNNEKPLAPNAASNSENTAAATEDASETSNQNEREICGAPAPALVSPGLPPVVCNLPVGHVFFVKGVRVHARKSFAWADES